MCFNRLLAADYTDQAVAEHVLYYLSQCLQVFIAYIEDFVADALAQLNGNVLQILRSCLVKTHAVGQGLIHRADGTDTDCQFLWYERRYSHRRTSARLCLDCMFLHLPLGNGLCYFPENKVVLS